jgi:hypothetical protein
MFPRAAPDADAGSDDSLDATDVSALARQHTREAVAVLVAALSGPSVRDRITAAEALLNVGHGRPVQPLAIDGGSVHVVAHGMGELHRPNGDDEPAGWELFRERGD